MRDSTAYNPHAPALKSQRRGRSLRRRLWVAGGALSLFIGTIVFAGNWIFPDAGNDPAWRILGRDFLVSYCAAQAAAEGRYDEMQDRDRFMARQQRTAAEAGLELGNESAPWLNPPFYAAAIQPLGRMTYQTAWRTWVGASAAALLLSAVLLARMARGAIHCRDEFVRNWRDDGNDAARGGTATGAGEGSIDAWARAGAARRQGAGAIPAVASRAAVWALRDLRDLVGDFLRVFLGDWRTWGLVLMLLLASMPVIQTLCCGQNSCFSLLLLTLVVTLWRSGRGFGAGAMAGLMMFKPQLGVVVAVALVVSLGRRPLMGLMATGCLLAAASEWAAPGMLWSYAETLPEAVKRLQVEGSFVWNRHATFTSFWHLLLNNQRLHLTGPLSRIGLSADQAAAWLAVGCRSLFGLFLVTVSWRGRRDDAGAGGGEGTGGGATRDRMIAATVAAVPLVMPYYVDYDLLLLAVPLVLLGGDLLAYQRDGLASSASPDAAWPVLRRRTRGAAADRWTVRAWIALYTWLFVNPALTAMTGVNLTVPLLAVAAAGMIARSLRRDPEPAPLREPLGRPLARAA